MGRIIIKLTTSDGAAYDIRANNGQIVAVSPHFPSEAACRERINDLRNSSALPVDDSALRERAQCPPPKYVIFSDFNGNYRFALLAADGQILAVSLTYKTKASCVKGIRVLKRLAADAEVFVMRYVKNSPLGEGLGDGLT